MRSPVRSGRRARLAAVAALAGMAAAGLAGWSPTAAAGMPDTVSFTGGCGVFASGVGGKSSPDASRVGVAAGAQVEFANHLGEPATLRLDGKAIADVAPGTAVEVTFHAGPVTAAMQIDCLLGKPSGTVRIDVTAGPPPSSPPSSPTSGGGTSGGHSGSGSGGSGSPGSGSSSGGSATGSPGGAATGSDPTGPASAGSAPGGSGPGGSAPGGSGPGGPASGWSAPTGPTGGGAWPGGRPPDSPAHPGAGAEDGDQLGAGWDDPTDGGGQPDPAATVDEQAVDDRVAAEQLTRTAESAPSGEPIGLLALIATVCVVGVLAGAVRTMLTQRANRAEWA